MKCQRGDVLNNYLISNKLKELTTLSEEELEKVNFSDDSSDLLVEAIKKLIYSYCNEDSEAVILRNINTRISS